jgi:hypothetical protein
MIWISRIATLSFAAVLLAPGLGYDVPDGWETAQASSRMRLAQWTLPGDGDEAAEVVIFFFGPGQGGGVEANLARWFSQFEQPDGSSTKDQASVTKREVNGLRLTIADMRGTYIASVRPGATERHHRPEHRMIAAVIDGDGGPWYLRVLGPEATVAKWETSVEAFLSSLEARP